MATYSVYLKHEAESELISSARKLGISPIDLIRNRIAQGAVTDQNKVANRKLDAMFFVMELLAREVGFVSGLLRAGHQANEKIYSAGLDRERQSVESIKACRNELDNEGISSKF